mmetsp:Transcript_25214/g.84785  ORF Transcript_25214/g.84785 Transcript_25214/m.84785 type:complete len:252 (+) Transcript_25214:1042-1797(+)
MMPLKDLLMRSNFLASSGSCMRMSSLPTKMDSRYIHCRCTLYQTSKVSLTRFNVFSHPLTFWEKAPTKRDPAMVCRFSMLSSSVSLISSAAPRTWPRIVPSLKYSRVSSEVEAQVASMARISFSIFSSFTASRTISSMASANFWSSMAKILPRVNCLALSKATPVTSEIFFQCRSFIASFFSDTMTGNDSLKLQMTTSTSLNFEFSLSAQGNLRAFFSALSTPHFSPFTSKSPQTDCEYVVRKSWNSLNSE